MRGCGAVDRPFGREHGLIALHPDVARLVDFAHEVAHGLVLGHFEIEIGLHAARVHVCGHRVPHASGQQLGHAHLQLAGRQHLVHEHLVDVAVVRPFERTHVGHHGVGFGDLLVGVVAVCGQRVEIEFGGIPGVLAREGHLAVARTEVEGLLVAEFEHGVAGLHHAGASDVVDAHFAAREEERSLQRVDGFEAERLGDRHGASDDHAVVHRVDHVDLVGREYLFDQEIAAQTRRVVAFRILGMRRIADFVIGFHSYNCCIHCIPERRAAARSLTRSKLANQFDLCKDNKKSGIGYPKPDFICAALSDCVFSPLRSASAVSANGSSSS